MRLTNREEEIMAYLWEHGESFVKDIILSFEEPKPHYNTISTIVRTLEKKGCIDHKDYGTTFKYYAAISKEAYGTQHLQKQVKKYFNNSFSSMVSSLVESNNLTVDEINELIELAKTKSK